MVKEMEQFKRSTRPKMGSYRIRIKYCYSSTNPAHTTKIIEFRDELVKNKIWWEPIQEERTMSPIFY